jgi:MoxR-like ATPase
VLATQNPIESEGTYPLPEAQVDRFLFKILVDYPSASEEASVVGRSLETPAKARPRLTMAELEAYAEATKEIFVDRDVIAYAVALVDATRRPEEHGLGQLRELIAYGASPRGAIGMVQSARALALLRGRRHVLIDDVRDLAPDVLRHRIVLSYEALSENVSTDDILEKVLDKLDPDAAARPASEARGAA